MPTGFKSVVDTTIVVAGSVSDFNKAAFRTDLRTTFPAATDIKLTVAGGSVSVAARLVFGGSAAAQAAAAMITSAQSDPTIATAWFAASGHAAESLTSPVVATTLILAPSPPSLPTLERQDSLLNRDSSPFAADGDYAPAFVFQVHLMALGGSLGVTMLLLMAATLVHLPVSCAATTTIAIGSSTFGVDVAFAWFAWHWANSFVSDEGGAGEQDQAGGASDPLILAYLAQVSAAVPVALGGLAPLSYAMVDSQRLHTWRQSLLVRLVLLLSLINVELLQIIPWTPDLEHLSGFPSAFTVKLGAVALLVGDAAQLTAQAYFLHFLRPAEQGAATLYLSAVSVLAIALAAASIWARGLRKFIIVLCLQRKQQPVDSEQDVLWSVVPRTNASASSTRAANAETRCQGGDAMRLVAAAARQQQQQQQRQQQQQQQQQQLRKLQLHPCGIDQPSEANDMPQRSPYGGVFPPELPSPHQPRQRAMRWLSGVESPSPTDAGRDFSLGSLHEGGVAIEDEPSPASQTALSRARAARARSTTPLSREMSEDEWRVVAGV